MTSDVVVVGAGAVGSTLAYELTRAGLSVEVLEQSGAVATGCSHANAGLLTPVHTEPLTGMTNIRAGLTQMFKPAGAFRISPRRALSPWMLRFLRSSTPLRVQAATTELRAFARAGLAGHVEYAEAGLDTGLRQEGILNVYGRAASCEHAVLGPGSTRLSAEQVSAKVPGMAGVAGGVFHPGQAHCDGRAYTEAVMGAARDGGAALSLHTPVTSLATESGRVVGVETPAGRRLAGVVVLAAGTASTGLARPAGLRPALAPGKGYVIDLEPGDADPPMPVSLKDELLVLTPYPDRLRIAGLMELRDGRTTVDRARVEQVLELARTRWPALRGRDVLQAWAGARPCSADGLPYVGVSRRVPGLALACGHAQQGLVLAPSTARRIRDEIVHGTSHHGLLDPDR